MDVLIGCDIGQKRDPTAVCVAELEWRGGSTAGRDDHYIIRHLGRLPLGTPYPEVVAEVVRIRETIAGRVIEQEPEVQVVGLRNDELHYARPPIRPNVTLYVDSTGVGQPVVDLLEAAGVYPIACTFMSGERRTKVGREVRLGKGWMVSRLQALAQTGRIHLPRTAEAEATRQELLDYEIRVSQDGADSFGAFRTGKHDDLVTALGLATQATPLQAYVY